MNKRNLVNTKGYFLKGLMLVFMIVLSTAIAIGIYIGAKRIGGADFSEAFAGAIGAGATLIGAFLIIYQLSAEKRVTCSQMLSDLNFKFIENERLMLLYRELEKAYKDHNYHLEFDNNDPNKVHDSDLMGYLTFYETLNEYIDHGVLEIGQMNDLFGDRFFKLIHNIDIQERELYAEPSSYVNIFELYSKWINYRRALEKRGLARFSVRSELAIPYLYVKERTFMKETSRVIIEPKEVTIGKSKFQYRRLFPKDFAKCNELQNKVVELLKKEGKEELFFPTTENEFYESFLIDYAYGLFDGDKLVALAIIVLNRNTARNITKYVPNEYGDNCSNMITFDTVQVDPDYRGKGIQKFFLGEADWVAKEISVKYIAATVSKDNAASYNNFKNAGYEEANEAKMYGGLDRVVMLKEIK